VLGIAAFELDASRLGPNETCKRTDERRLAGAVRTNDHKRFARTCRE